MVEGNGAAEQGAVRQQGPGAVPVPTAGELRLVQPRAWDGCSSCT
jgi:hypothetical protein